MREDVCIVLNERESVKKQMAAELVQELSALHLSAERLQPVSNISEIILERLPRVVVLDYLLGDFGTALDILTDLKNTDPENRIKKILWTDESSAGVAVSALKLGASDYIELGSSNSLRKLIQAVITELIPASDKRPIPNAGENLKLGAQSQIFRRAMIHGKTLARKNQPVVLLLGPTGSGRNTVGEYIHQHRPFHGILHQIDYSTFADTITSITGGNQSDLPDGLLSSGATVLIDHIEIDNGELLQQLALCRERIWESPLEEKQPMLIVGTTDQAHARSWHKVLGAEVIELPALSERSEDFYSLVQLFSQQTQALTRNLHLKPIVPKVSQTLISKLIELEWPGNVRELRAVTIEALNSPLDELDSESLPRTANVEGLSHSDRSLLAAFLIAKERWERFGVESD